jgi:hypothetical protein
MPDKKMNNRPFQTPSEIAGEWNVSPDHVRRLCRTGRIAGALLIGTIWRIPVDAKLEYERLHRGPSKQAA